jgi:adenylosuccinate synthase
LKNPKECEMSSTAVLGCMWGDEAKAKIVDVLATDADMVVRFQGGNNAGHTIKLGDQKYVFHLVPSGILYPDKECILGSGVVIDIVAMNEEIEKLKSQGVNFSGRFFIDPRAQIVLPLHKELDAGKEADRKNKIGTTRRGIGPCYADAIARVGIRFGDLFRPQYLIERLKNNFSYHNLPDLEVEKVAAELMKNAEPLRECLKQVPYYLASSSQKEILFEGAQGSLLDVYFGSYPYVTSSHTISGGISIGAGFPHNKIEKVVGVYKSYFTRVGSGPFPTELFDEVGKQIALQGNEFGSTTGRPRRCGWFDLVAAKFTAMLNGLDEVALTLVDVLSGLPELKICTSYLLDGKELSEFPDNPEDLARVQPQYISLPIWKEDISKIKEYADLPQNARNYVEKIETLLGVPITIISVGPERTQTIFR